MKFSVICGKYLAEMEEGVSLWSPPVSRHQPRKQAHKDEEAERESPTSDKLLVPSETDTSPVTMVTDDLNSPSESLPYVAEESKSPISLEVKSNCVSHSESNSPESNMSLSMSNSQFSEAAAYSPSPESNSHSASGESDSMNSHSPIHVEQAKTPSSTAMETDQILIIPATWTSTTIRHDVLLSNNVSPIPKTTHRKCTNHSVESLTKKDPVRSKSRNDPHSALNMFKKDTNLLSSKMLANGAVRSESHFVDIKQEDSFSGCHYSPPMFISRKEGYVSSNELRGIPPELTHLYGDAKQELPGMHDCRWSQCSMTFLSLEHLVTHVNDEHVKMERDVEYTCRWQNCPRKGRGFNARYKMLIHVRTHTNEKPHTCHQCGKCFSRLENLKIHTRTHTGERPYICPFEGCNKAYSNSSDRFKHVRTHQVQKPYCCRTPGCSKSYTDPSSLRKHIKTHQHYFKGGPLPVDHRHAKLVSPLPRASSPSSMSNTTAETVVAPASLPSLCLQPHSPHMATPLPATSSSTLLTVDGKLYHLTTAAAAPPLATRSSSTQHLPTVTGIRHTAARQGGEQAKLAPEHPLDLTVPFAIPREPGPMFANAAEWMNVGRITGFSC